MDKKVMLENLLSWISQHNKRIRLVFLLLLPIAIIGPWTFSSDGVPPAEYCHGRSILLENRRCVKPISGANVLTIISSAVPSMILQLISDPSNLTERVNELLRVFLFLVLIFILLLPFLRILRIVLSNDRSPHLKYPELIGGSALVISTLLFIVTCQSEICLKLWGNWLYMLIAACTVVVEISVARKVTA
jgi:hypothetical protein